MNPSNVIAIQKPAAFDLSPQTFEQALTFADYLADSDMVPKDFKGKPGNCLIAMQWGMEVGLKPLQAMQNIAVINGRPSLWGDALIAIVRASPLCEYVIEEMDSHGTAVCKTKRRGETEQTRTFSDQDAQVAGLKGKQGPWSTNPKRMKQMRARAFALRDVFPDVLKGMPMAEEVMDIPVAKDMGEADQPNRVDVIPYIAGVTALMTDADAADYWKVNNGKFSKHAADHAALKQAVINRRKELVASKTVENGAKSAPAEPTVTVTFEKVMADLTKAKNHDALDVAADWIGEVPDPAQRAELSAKYDELKALVPA